MNLYSDLSNNSNQDLYNEIENSWRNEFKAHRTSEWISLNQMISQVVIKYLSVFCNVDLNRYDLYCSKKVNKHTDLHETRLTNPPRWLRIYNITFLISSIFTISYLLLQYRYDINLHKYNEFLKYSTINSTTNKTSNGQQQSNNDTSTSKNDDNNYNNNNNDREFNLLKEQIEFDRNILTTIGAPFLDHYFAIEIPYDYILYMSFVVFVEIHLYIKFINGIDVRTIKTIYNREKSIETYSKVVADEVNEFILSSKNVVTEIIKNLNEVGRLKTIRENSEIDWNESLKTISDHFLLIEQLKCMAINSNLRPINRDSNWIDILTILYNAICFASYAGILFINVFFWLSTLNTFGWRTGIKDLLVALQFLSHAAVATATTLFYFDSMSICIIDYIYLVGKLKNITYDCIRNNTLSLFDELKRYDGSKASNSGSYNNNTTTTYKDYYKTFIEISNDSNIYYGKHLCCYSNKFNYGKQSLDDFKINNNNQVYKRNLKNYKFKEMNYNLLYVIIQYKLLMRQLKYNKTTLSLVSYCTFQIQLLGPILLFFHAPYIKDEFIPVMATTLLLFSAFADACLIPIAHMHSRCLDLCKALFSLLAHCRQSVDPQTGEYVYSLHNIAMLSKEVNQSDQFMKQFAITVFSYPITYPVFLRVHIFTGLLMFYSLTNLSRSNADKGLLNSSLTTLFF